MKTRNLTRIKSLTHFSLFMGIMMLFSFSLKAEKVNYPDAWGEDGMTITKSSAQKIVINYSINSFSFEKMNIKGEEMERIALPGNFLFNNEGAPNLPGGGRFIALPNGARAKLNILEVRKDVYKNKEIAPAPRIPKEDEKGPLTYSKDPKVYDKDAFYPAQPFKLSEQKTLRGVNAVIVGVTPFQYNPVTKELIVYRDVKLEVTYEGGNGYFGDDRYRSRWYDPLLRDALMNYEMLPEIDYSKRTANRGKDNTGYEYLIVSPNGPEFQQWADSIREFRTMQGIHTGVVTLDEIGGNTPSVIENYINDAYNNWDIPPVAVLLLGDYGSNANNSVTSPIYNGYCASDHIYADVDGDDVEEIIFARMTAQNETQLQTLVTKAIHYEKDPPTNQHYYDHPITALGWQTERWFQICSETVGGFWKHEMDKEPLRVNDIYSGNPNSDPWSTNQNTSMVLDYFGPDGLGYIPATPQELGGWTGGTASMVNQGINDGAFMIQHRDHGGETGWGEPDYDNNDINGLYNEDLTFVFSINCLTGKYNWSNECFTEKFHRHTYEGQNAGALGVIAASEVSYSFVNDTYVWGMYDNMWPDFMPTYGSGPIPNMDVRPAFGNAAGKYFLMQSNWPYNTNNKEVTYNLFHHHGDAFTTVYTEMPQTLTVNHDPILYSGNTSFNVTADEGSFIALTVNGEIIGTAEGTGSPVTITIPPQFPPDHMIVTITKQNYFRYAADIQVIPPEGPYVVRDSWLINDESGNNNGMADYGESLLLDMAVKNVGVELAENVNVILESTDPYVTITDAEEFYGDINPDEIINIEDAFALDIAWDIPDGHTITFAVLASDGNETWESYFSITGHAPILAYDNYSIADPNGNGNGRLDPGEEADISVSVVNDGSADAYEVEGELTSTDQYVTINTDPQMIGEIMAGGSGEATFNVYADEGTPTGHMANFTFDYTAQGGISGSGSFFVIVGQIPAVIIDLDGNNNSGPDMEEAMNNLGVPCDYMTSFPDDLNLYSSAWVCLGIYGWSSGNHVLSTSEGQLLADYLEAGGQLYMEGGDTWYYDDSTPVHAMFNIDGVADGSGNLSTVNGIAGTFTEGMSFSYSGDNNYIDHIAPMGNAFEVLENQSPDYGTAVAYDEGGYKTIGASHEYGGLGDAEDLMLEYLTFFGLYSEEPNANFEANVTDILQGESVEFTDLSQGNPTSWEWTFEGGTPATSTEANPTVTYNEAGQFDVSLMVTNNYGASSMLIEDYINVTPVYEPHWEFEGGNPADPVYTIYLGAATLDDVDLEFGDEIGIFDGETMVGHFLLEEVLTPENQLDNALIAFSTVVSGNGYDPGNPIMLKCWDASEEVEVGTFTIDFSNPYGDAWVEDYFPDGDGQYSLAELSFTTGGGMQMMLSAGYQFMSTYMEPTNPDLMYLCEDLMYDETLDFIRNSEGSMLQKIGPNWINNIGMWNTMEGYLFKMNADDDFMMEGTVMDPQTPMGLYSGYQFISYLPASSMDALQAVDNILDNLDFMRNSDGSMLQKIGPNWINNIGNMNPGEGYLVKMNADDELIYPEVLKAATPVASAIPSYFNFAGGNPADPVFTIYVEPGMGIAEGDEVAAFSNGRLLGSTVITSQQATSNDLAVFSTLNETTGYQAGDPIELRLWDSSEDVELPLEYDLQNPYGDAHMSATYPQGDGEYSIIRIKTTLTGMDKDNMSVNYLKANYPNPFKDQTTIEYGIAKDAYVNLTVYNGLGQPVKVLIDNNVASGAHTVLFDAHNLPQGVYQYKLEVRTGADTYTKTRMMIIR